MAAEEVVVGEVEEAVVAADKNASVTHAAAAAVGSAADK